jgi:choline dehydrogenase-like flavoprotein
MLYDFRDLRELSHPSHAAVVVGSGAAGLAVALTLGDSGRQVVLLESGGRPTDTVAANDAAVLNQGVVEGLPFRLSSGRARILGGTTHLWHGQCMRLHDIDMRERPWVPHSGWPFELNELSRYYAKAEQWIGVSGLGYGAARWAEHPRRKPIPWTPDRLLHDFTEYVRQPQLGQHYFERLSRHSLVSTVVNATVSRVMLRDGAVCGVEVLGVNGRREMFYAPVVVLAAGAIENARLLKLSDPEGVGLGLGRDLTGRFFRTHPIIHTAEVRPKDYATFQNNYILLRRGRRRLFPKVRLSPPAQEKHELLDATAVFLHEYDDPGFQAIQRLLHAVRARRWPEFAIRDLLRGSRSTADLMRDAYRRLVRGLPTGVRPSRIALELWLEQAPDAESRVSLDETQDVLGMRRAKVRWRCSEQEIRTSRTMTGWIADDLNRLGLADLRDLPAMQDDDAWLASVLDAAHPAGTTRMSADPRKGVVDADLQVHGVQGLFVVGSSVFPTCGYANPTLTIVALAMRLAERLIAMRIPMAHTASAQ